MSAIGERDIAILTDVYVRHRNFAEPQVHNPVRRISGRVFRKVVTPITSPRRIEARDVDPHYLVVAAPLANEGEGDEHRARKRPT